jgi:hypothetical protein
MLRVLIVVLRFDEKGWKMNDQGGACVKPTIVAVSFGEPVALTLTLTIGA